MVINSNQILNKGYNIDTLIKTIYHKGYVIYGNEIPFVKIIFSDSTEQIDRYASGLIPSNAYKGNTNIIGVELNEISNVENNAFSGCTNLNTFTVNGDIDLIGDGCFLGCDSLSSARFNGNVGKIGDYAFYNCSNLSNMGSTASIYEFGAHSCDGTNLPAFNFNSVSTAFGEYAFSNNVNMTFINLPNGSTESIPSYCFYGCSSLVKINFGNSQTAVPTLENANAFDGLPNDYKIIVPNNLESEWKTATNWNDVASHIIAYSDYYYGLKIKFKDGTERIDRYTNGIIPSDTYDDNSNIINIETSKNIRKINSQAFSRCSFLSGVTLNEGLTEIGKGAFSVCGSLSALTIPNSVTTLGESLFNNCDKLTSVNIPSGVTSIEQSTFNNCSGLTSIELPSGLTSLSSAFSGCSSLTTITIPNGVDIIYGNTFSNCSSLREINFGNTRATIPELRNPNAFTNLPNNYVIVVPDALVTNWKNNSWWFTSSISSHIIAYSDYYV